MKFVLEYIKAWIGIILAIVFMIKFVTMLIS